AGKELRYWHHYRSLPKYGAFWDYRRDGDFYEWFDNVPRWLLMRQLTTFSARFEVEEATRRLRELDYVFARDFDFGSERVLFEAIGIEYSSDFVPKAMNKSDQSVTLPADAAAILRDALTDEYEMLRMFG